MKVFLEFYFFISSYTKEVEDFYFDARSKLIVRFAKKYFNIWYVLSKVLYNHILNISPSHRNRRFDSYIRFVDKAIPMDAFNTS